MEPLSRPRRARRSTGFSPKALASVQTFVDSRIGAWAWNDLLLRALLAPAFIALTLLSAALFFLSS
jgi:hypothetical protein